MSRSNRLLFFFLAWVGMIFYFMQRWIFGPLIPSLMTTFNADKTTLGVVGAASLWGYMFTPIPAGFLSDRFGRKHVILTGIFGFSALTALCGLATSSGQLFAGRFFTGMVEAAYFIPLLAFTLELFPERPGFFLTFMTSGSSLGWFIGPALAGWLLDVTGSWRVPFLATGCAGLVVAFLLLMYWPKQEKALKRGTLLDRNLLKSSSLIMLLFLALTATFQISAEFGFNMWYPVFLRTELLTSATVAGITTGLWGAGQCIGRPILGLAADRMGYRKVGVAGGVMMTVALMLILSAHNPYFCGLFTFLGGFISASVMGSLWTFTGLVFPSSKGLALGIITTFAYATASLGPISIGYIGDHYSLGTALWAVCVPCAFLAACMFLATVFLKKGPTLDS